MEEGKCRGGTGKQRRAKRRTPEAMFDYYTKSDPEEIFRKTLIGITRPPPHVCRLPSGPDTQAAEHILRGNHRRVQEGLPATRS